MKFGVQQSQAKREATALSRLCLGFFAATICCLQAACEDSNGGKVYPIGASVPVQPGAANQFFDELDEIVVTDLYSYDDSELLKSQYIVAGPPLSFAFPKAAYASHENGRGGPQWSIDLRLDRQTMQPFAVLLAEAGATGWRRTGDNTRHLNHRRLSVTVHSNLSARSTARQAKYWLDSKYWPGGGPDEEMGTICDFRFVRPQKTHAVYSSMPLEKIADRQVPFGNYQGLSIGKQSNPRIALCVASSPICIVGFDYQGRQVTFDITREELCESENYVGRISAELEKRKIDKALR